MVAVELVLARVDVPGAEAGPVHAEGGLLAREGLEVVFRDVGAVGAQPGFVLHFGRVGDVGEGGEEVCWVGLASAGLTRQRSADHL